MIRKLAIYEKEPLTTVEATEATLHETLCFASADSPTTTQSATATRPARCLLIFGPDSTTPAGMALYYYSYSTWRSRAGIYLEDLFVVETARGRGYGKALLKALANEVQTMGGARLEWSVLKWNEPSIKFYEAMGAQPQHEWLGMRVDGDALVSLANRQ